MIGSEGISFVFFLLSPSPTCDQRVTAPDVTDLVKEYPTDCHQEHLRRNVDRALVLRRTRRLRSLLRPRLILSQLHTAKSPFVQIQRFDALLVLS